MDDSDMKLNDNMDMAWDKSDSECSEVLFDKSDNESDNDSDNEFKSEELDGFFEFGEDNGGCVSNDEPAKFPFEGKPGIRKLPKGSDADDYFELLFDENFFSMIVTETNKHAETVVKDQWVQLSIPELKIFLGLLLHMGIVRCLKIECYWNSGRLFNLNSFSRHMNRHRFVDILRLLSFSSSSRNNNYLGRILPIVDYFNNKMEEIYYPHRELAIDETIVPWRARSAFGQYTNQMKLNFAVKVYVLSESSGITLRLNCAANRIHRHEKGHVSKVVLNILEGFLQKGHSVFMDNVSTNLPLVENLFNSKTYCTGTSTNLKNEKTEEITKAKLSCKFKNKRNIWFISSEYKNNLVALKRKGRKIKKPLALYKYNQFRTVIDRKDQMLVYYTCSRNTFKWNIKFWIYLVETLLLNAFHLYARHSPSASKSGFYGFRLKIIDTLLFTPTMSPVVEQPKHLPQTLPRGKNNLLRRKKCRQCNANGIKREVSTCCSACPNVPGLCLGKCFIDFHESL